MTETLPLTIVDPPKAPKVKKATAAEKAVIAGDETTFTVPFGTIHMADNVRSDMTTDVADLAASIRSVGMATPIGLRRQPDKHGDTVYVVEVGHRRYMALRALGLNAADLVPAHIMTAVDDGARVVRQWDENRHRRALSPLDEARTIERLISLEQLTITAAAKALGMTRETAAKRRNLLHLPEDAQALVVAGDWDLEAAQLTGKFAKDGATAKTVENLVGKSHWQVEEKVRAAANKKVVAKHRRHLEARGIAVEPNLSKIDAPKGKVASEGSLLDLGTVADIKAADPDKLDTIRRDGKPVVYLTTTWEGKPSVRAIIYRKDWRAPTTASGTNNLRAWDNVNAVNQGLHAERLQAIIDHVAAGGVDNVDDARMWRSLFGLLLQDTRREATIAAVAELGELDVIMSEWDAEKIDTRRTGEQWAADETITGPKARTLTYALLLAKGATEIQDDETPTAYDDETDEELGPEPPTLLAQLAVAAGARGPVVDDEYEALLKQAMADNKEALSR